MIVKVNRPLDKSELIALEVNISSRLMREAKKKRSKIAQARLHDYITNGLKVEVVEDGKS